jgi:hypothetical protein
MGGVHVDPAIPEDDLQSEGGHRKKSVLTVDEPLNLTAEEPEARLSKYFHGEFPAGNRNHRRIG